MSGRRIVSTPDAPAAIGPYSQAVAVGGLVFVSGQVPINPATGKIEAGDIEGQTRQALTNIAAILAAEHLTMKDVVKTTVLLQNMKDFKDMNGVYATFFPKEPPARAAFQVARLPLDALVEIEAVAARPE